MTHHEDLEDLDALMRDLNVIRELPSGFEGEPAQAEVANEAQRLLDSEGGEIIATWLSRDHQAAFQVANQIVWNVRAAGQPVVVHMTGPHESDPQDVKVYSYEDEKSAYQNACKLFLACVLDHVDEQDVLRHGVGWQQDLVLLVKGHDFYCIRTHHTGHVDVESSEYVHSAYGLFANAVDNLSDQILMGDLPGLRDNPFYPKIASAFVLREAGAAIQSFARHSLSLSLDAALSVQKLGGPDVNMSEIARNLHTDRPNLIRYQGKSTLADMTPEKMAARLGADWVLSND